MKELKVHHPVTVDIAVGNPPSSESVNIKSNVVENTTSKTKSWLKLQDQDFTKLRSECLIPRLTTFAKKFLVFCI